MRLAEETIGVHIRNYHLLGRRPPRPAQHDNDIANIALDQPLRVGKCSALDLPQQVNKPELLSIAFLATKEKYTTGSTQADGKWPSRPL